MKSSHRTSTGRALAPGLALLVAVAALGCGKKADEAAAPTAPTPEVAGEATTPMDETPRVAAPDPDPDYPTPAAAGTEGIFFLEEPERGPWITTRARPEVTGPWRWHATCDAVPGSMDCGPELAVRPRAGWRVAQLGATSVADEIVGEMVLSTWIFDLDDAGRMERAIELDAFGEVVAAQSFEPPGEQLTARARDGSNALPGCGTLKLARDDAGRTLSSTCVSWLGEPMRDIEGIVRTTFERDPATGLVTGRRLLDASGAPAAAHDGVHRRTTRRDAEGRPVVEAAFDLDGAPTIDARSGCAAIEMRWQDGLVAGWRCLGPDGAPAVGVDGWITSRVMRDDRGCMIREDIEGPGRVRARAFEVGARCERLAERCFGAREEAVGCAPEAAHEVRYGRDDRGRVVNRRGLGPGGEPVALLGFGAPEERLVLDEHGRALRTSCHGADGGPVECGAIGFHAKLQRYDDAGRDVEVTFEGTDGRRADNLGTWSRRSTWDAYDHRREVAYLDVDGGPGGSLGASSMRYVYDDGHRLFGILLFDQAGEPSRYRGCFTGRNCPPAEWHALRVVRAPSGRALSNVFFDAAKQRVAEIPCDDSPCWR